MVFEKLLESVTVVFSKFLLLSRNEIRLRNEAYKNLLEPIRKRNRVHLGSYFYSGRYYLSVHDLCKLHTTEFQTLLKFLGI